MSPTLMGRLFAVVVLLLALAGCSGATAGNDTADTTPSPAFTPPAGWTPSIAEQQQATGPANPAETITIDRLGLDNAPLMQLGLNADRTIQVPDLSRPRELGVYARGPQPGEPGPAVILGHVNARGQDGAFAQLSTMQVGDTVTTDVGGQVAEFVVYRTARVLKADFPTAEIYSDTAGPELRLITCGGALDASGHNYDSNDIVWLRKA